MITVTKRYKFNASHRLHSASFSDEENGRVFGKCNNPFGHGHNYEVEVSVRGDIDPRSGRVVDLTRLDDLVGHTIIERYDHRYLNEELSEFQSDIPTTENLGRQIERRLADAWSSAFPAAQPELDRIRIHETNRNIVEVQHAGSYENK